MANVMLTGSWLAARYGVDPIRIERRRRAGELLATRERGEWRYPGWQFDAEGRVRPDVQRLLEAAKGHRIGHERLQQLLERKVGLVGGTSLRDLLLSGGRDEAIAAVTSAA